MDAAAKNWPVGIGLATCIVALSLQSLLISLDVPALLTFVFQRDDAFYYLQIAHSLAFDGIASFDGIHRTSGIQFLWGFLLVPVAYVAGDEVAFMRLVLGLCLLTNTCVAVQLFYLGRRMHSPIVGDLAVLFWAGVLIRKWNTFEGMEFSLHLSIAVAISYSIWPFLFGMKAPKVKSMLALGALLTANYWVRLDSAIYSLAAWAAVAVVIWQAESQRLANLAALTVLPAIGAVAFVATSWALAGTYLPISGLAKEVYESRFFDGFSSGQALKTQFLWWIRIQIMMFMVLVPEILAGVFVRDGQFNPLHSFPNLVFLLSAAGLTFAAAWRILRSGITNHAVKFLSAVAFLSAFHALVVIAVIGDFAHVSRHYYAWLLLFWMLFGALGFSALFDASIRYGRHVALVFATAYVIAFVPTAIANFSPENLNQDDYSVSRLKLAERLDDVLPKNAIVGAWNAGVLGYFLNRPVVNLDGLVNDREFIEVLESEQSILPYLKREGIGFLIDHDKRDLTARYLEKRGGEGSDYRNIVPWANLEVIDQEGEILVLKLAE